MSRLDCLLPFQSGDDCSETVIIARAERLVSRQDVRPAIKMGAADVATKSCCCTPRRIGSIADYLPNVSAESGGASCQMKSSPAFRFFATCFFGCRRSVPPAARTETAPIRVMSTNASSTERPHIPIRTSASRPSTAESSLKQRCCAFEERSGPVPKNVPRGSPRNLGLAIEEGPPGRRRRFATVVVTNNRLPSGARVQLPLSRQYQLASLTRRMAASRALRRRRVDHFKSLCFRYEKPLSALRIRHAVGCC